MSTPSSARSTCLARTLPIFVACLTVVTGGCGTHRMYKDPLPAEYVATVKGIRTTTGVRIFFRVVNGDGTEDVVYSIEVPNGPQSINVYFSTVDGAVSPSPRKLEFYAEGGRTYRIKGADYGDRVWIWVEEDQTDVVVGGRKP